MFDFRGRELDIRTIEGFKQLQKCSTEDGAIVVDGQTCMLVAANFMVTSIGKGDRKGGGARHGHLCSPQRKRSESCF